MTTAQLATFSVPNAPTVAAPGVSDAVQKAMSKGLGDAAGRAQGALAGAGRLGGMAKMNFFGVKTQSRRIAFLLDYSGSMSGPFRATMETEIERSLKDLPAGTEVLIIPWAGGAWLYDELASEISAKWKKIDSFDNFAIRPGEKLTPPKWVSINPDNVRKLLKGVLAQKAWPGGTDLALAFQLRHGGEACA